MLEQALEPGTVVALNDDERQIAEQDIYRRDGNAARARPYPEHPKAENGQNDVSELGRAGFAYHERQVGEVFLREPFCRHEAGEKAAHIRHPRLPPANVQRAPELFLPRMAAPRKALCVEPALGHEPAEYEKHGAERRHIYDAVYKSHSRTSPRMEHFYAFRRSFNVDRACGNVVNC